MLFNSPFLSLLAIAGLSNASLIKHKRDTGISLYAYGSDTNGAPVFYSEGLAYIGQKGLDDVTRVQTNITFGGDSSDSSVPWPIYANSSTVTFNETLYMYILPSSGAFSQVGFATNSSLPDGAVDTGFAWFGTSVAYAASESDYELMFWGLNTTTDGVYGLYWNGGAITDGAFPITLKSTPPTQTN
ncbi:hypothetical protein G7Y89_g8183 [Cudoniella acicularis]|uniref:Uncharacterized protein n=1 Tax=Cudoniella acicularis TaxID=354080 RepID=A0A8H4W334_9HELO|nr:hypothetical protein G7Y89_g8183 [Cudoniella acicularis]